MKYRCKINHRGSNGTKGIPSRCPEITLWRAVIFQAMCDINLAPNFLFTEIDRIKSITWLTAYNSDFVQVCDMAHVSATDVMQVVKKRIKNEANH